MIALRMIVRPPLIRAVPGSGPPRSLRASRCGPSWSRSSVAFGYPLANGLTHLAHGLPGYVHDAERGRGPVGHLVRKYHIQHWITTNAKLKAGVLSSMSLARAERYSRIAREVNRSVTGYMLGNVVTSIIAGVVVFIALLSLGVPFPFLWALWVALVDFLPMIGGALAGIPVILFAAAHSLTAGLITLAVFLAYTQVENHVLNPLVMSRTVKVNPLLVLVSILVGASIGSWIGGIFGAFVAALLAIPSAGAIQVMVREIWLVTAPLQPDLTEIPDAHPRCAGWAARPIRDPVRPNPHRRAILRR